MHYGVSCDGVRSLRSVVVVSAPEPVRGPVVATWCTHETYVVEVTRAMECAASSSPRQVSAAVIDEPGVEPDAVLEGRAEDLDAWLWHRRDDAALEWVGDHAVRQRFTDITAEPMD